MLKKIVYHRIGKKPILQKDEEGVELSESDFMKFKVLSELASELRKARRQ